MRYRYYAIAQGINGDAISGASVSVYLAGSTTPANVYNSPSGGSGNNTPPQVTTGEDGSFQFWIEAGEYSYGQLFKLVIQKDSNSKTIDNVQVVIWDTTPYSIDASGANNNQVVVFNVTSQKLQAGPGVYVTSSGNVGIGTTNPFVKLDLGNNVNPSRVLAVHTNGTSFFYGFGNDNRGGIGYLDFYANSPIGTAGVDVKMTIGHNGNVGIGTTAPSQKLTVAGNIGLQAGANAFIGTLDNYALGLRTNNTDRVYVTSGGNVGIGTTVPAAKLHVVGGSQNLILAIGDSGAVPGSWVADTLRNLAGDWPDMTWYRALYAFDSSGGIAYDEIYGVHRYSINLGGERLTVTSGGNVGIGTTSPGEKLDVNGNIQASGQFKSTVATGTAPIVVSSTTLCSNLNSDRTDGYHASQTPAANTIPVAKSDGKLDSGWLPITGYWEGSGNNIYNTNTGNVGIGKSNPGEKLDVNGNIQASGQLKSTVATGTAPIVVSSTTLCSNLNSDRTDGYHASQTPTANTIPVAKSDGKLDSGWLPITGYWEGSGNNIYNTNTGNVGIGISTPGEKLDVNGNIQASGQLKSTVATGTAPIVVNSTTVCDNLNAKLWDGAAKHVSTSDPSGGNDGDVWFKYV